MGSPFEFVDLLIFGAVAVFLVMRLGGVLGKKTGHQERNDISQLFGGGSKDGDDVDTPAGKDAEDNVVHLGKQGSSASASSANTGTPANDAATRDMPDEEEGPLDAGFSQIRAVDPSFHPDHFIEGARGAFEMILKAYSDGDEQTLKDLLAPDVYTNFSTAIRDRINAGQRLEEVFVGMDGADILEARMDGHNALVTVKFVSQQAHALYDVDGVVVDGDPNHVTTVTDIWTFQRDTRSNNPNWALAATRSSN